MDENDDVYALLGVQPIRAEILRVTLARHQVTAAELMEELDLTRNGVGKHLTELTNAGLLVERRATHPRGTGGIIYWSADRAAITNALLTLVGRILSHPRI
ncbi:helix-turn-helix domain-containing protein [Leifsonia sp. NPDC102414]|uniref:helix-turn-helix domain-containing protein n=1 Tax=Leifsonia sp. NPDC102414 TaxID=3364124 RepID=UPI003827FFC0